MGLGFLGAPSLLLNLQTLRYFFELMKKERKVVCQIRVAFVRLSVRTTKVDPNTKGVMISFFLILWILTRRDEFFLHSRNTRPIRRKEVTPLSHFWLLDCSMNSTFTTFFGFGTEDKKNGCLLRHYQQEFLDIPNSIKVTLAIGHWAFGYTELALMICLSDHQTIAFESAIFIQSELFLFKRCSCVWKSASIKKRSCKR